MLNDTCKEILKMFHLGQKRTNGDRQRKSVEVTLKRILGSMMKLIRRRKQKRKREE